MKLRPLAALVLAASSIALGCTSAKPLPIPKPFHCELTDRIRNDAIRYIKELQDPIVAVRGIFIPDVEADKVYANCLDKALREFGSNHHAEKWGLIRHEDGYLAIQVLY